MSEPLSSTGQTGPFGAAEAADLWIVRRAGGHDVEADQAFAAWLTASPENAKAWVEGVRLWDLVGGAEAADPLLDAMRRDALMARPAPAASWPLRAAAGIAAVLFVGVLSWTVLLLPRLHPSSAQPWVAANAAAAFSNGTALPRTVVLADGSKVTLDAGSSMAVAYDPSHRGVRLLQGRAFFDVVHDQQRPFRVEANDRWVNDMGTQFAVRMNQSVVTVALVEGSVSVGSAQAAHPQTLVPGQSLQIAADGSEHITQTDPDTDLAWRSGLLVFHETPLADAVAEINRYGGPPVVASGLGNLQVSGRFRAGDPRRFAHMLAEIYPVKVQDRPDGGAILKGAD